MTRKIYYAFALFCATMLAGVHASPTHSTKVEGKDSIIVSFGNQTKLIIYGDNRQELEKILRYDLNALLKDLKVKLDSSRSDTTYIREEVDGNNYLKGSSDKNDSDYVRIGLRGVHVKDGNTRVTINAKGVEVNDGDNTVTTDSTYRRTGKRFYRRSHWSASPRKGFNIAIGLNTYGTNETTPGFDKADYDLKPFDSRYISLGYVVSTTIIRGKNTRLHLDLGADFSWYNLMFDSNKTIDKNDERVVFAPLIKDNQEVELKKSKLVLPYLNLTLMPTLSFSRSFISHLSAGAYGGYRLGSYNKTRAYGTKDVDRVRKNFYIEDLRYGLAAELGIRSFPDLFVNYDLNNVYEAGRGPSVRMLSFGIRLF